jgi:Ca2+-dependent lipid-binding protein
VCIIGQEKQVGQKASGSGTSPQWSDTFVFNSKDQLMRVEVWDKDTFSSDDLIGEGSVNLMQLFMNPNKV